MKSNVSRYNIAHSCKHSHKKIFTNTANFISRIDHVYMEVFELFESHELHLWNISLRMLVFSINPLFPANCLFEALDFIFGIVAVALCSRDKSIPFFVSLFFLFFCFFFFLIDELIEDY